MEQTSAKKLQKTIVIAAILAVTLTGLLVAAVGIFPLWSSLREQSLANLSQVQSIQKIGISNYFRRLTDISRQIGSRTAIRTALQNYHDGILDRVDVVTFMKPKMLDALVSTPSIGMIARYDASGRRLLQVGESIRGGSLVNFNALLESNFNTLWFSQPFEYQDRSYILVANPLFRFYTGPLETYRPEDLVIGYDLIAFDVQELIKVIWQPSIIENGTFYVGYPNGYGADSSWTWHQAAQPLSSGLLIEENLPPLPALIAGKPIPAAEFESRGQHWVYHVHPVYNRSMVSGKMPQWHLLAMVPAETFNNPIYGYIGRIAIIMLCAVSAVGLGLWFVLRPLQGQLLVRTYDLELQVNQLKELKDSLSAERERLNRSNQDLEQFAYAASHDLQQPLRMISSFLSVFRKHYGSTLDQTGHEYIEYAETGALQMRDMVTDLLEYSRVGRIEQPFATVSLDHVANKAIRVLGLAIEEKNARIEVLPLPDVQGIESQIFRLFQNIIDNALKYALPDRPPVITISAIEKSTEAQWEIRVQDNGRGIAPDARTRAFQLFQRLTPDPSIQGTGMGLAMCAKIVKHHNGTIWLEGEEGVGTTVCFTLNALERQPKDDPGTVL